WDRWISNGKACKHFLSILIWQNRVVRLILAEGDVQADECKQRSLHKVYLSVYGRIFAQQISRFPGKQTDQNKNDQGYDQEKKPIYQHLGRDAAAIIIDELREKGQEEQGDFRVQQIHDDAF